MSTINDFKRVVANIKENQKRLSEGKFNCIPFSLPSLCKHVPGIIKGVPYIITANSGVGKTNLTKYLFVYTVYNFLKENPNSGIKVKMFYFPLEESKDEFILSMISRRLYDKYNIVLTVQDLQGYKKPFSVEYLKKIDECTEYFEEIFSCLEVIDHIQNPTGIYKYLRREAVKAGKFYWKGNEVIPPENDQWEKAGFRYDHYEETDPNLFIISLIDHVSLLKTESGLNKYDSITKWSADYSRTNLTKKFKQIVINVQQQAADSERQQFTMKGESIKDRIRPTLSGLGDNKLTARDALVVISLFAPYRHGFNEWEGWTLKGDDGKGLKDSFRELSILKNRFGTPNLYLHLYFNGAVGDFIELNSISNYKLKTLYK